MCKSCLVFLSLVLFFGFVTSFAALFSPLYPHHMLGPGGRQGGGCMGWGREDISINFNIDMNIDIHMIMNMNIENYIRYLPLCVALLMPYWYPYCPCYWDPLNAITIWLNVVHGESWPTMHHAWWLKHDAPCIMHRELCTMYHASCIMHLSPLFTLFQCSLNSAAIRFYPNLE